MAASGFLFGDTFDGYPTADILQKWTNFGNAGSVSSLFSVTSSAARNGAAGLRMSFPNWDMSISRFIRKSLSPGDPAAFCVNFAFRYNSPASSFTIPFLMIQDNATQQVVLAIRPDGFLEAFRGSSTSNSLGMSTTPILANNFYSLKFKGTIDPAVGTLALYINAVEQFNLTGLNTRNSAASQWTNVAFGQGALGSGGASVAITYDFDDIRVRDDDNGFFDTIGIILRAEAGNGTNTDYTPSTGVDHGALVDDTNQDGDTTYNSSSTVNHKDTYTLEDLPVSATIECVQTTEVCRKTDAGDRLVANVLRIGGTDYVGPDLAPNQTYSHLLTPYDDSPATASAFTDAEINAMESGQKITF